VYCGPLRLLPSLLNKRFCDRITRTHASIILAAQEAEAKGVPVRGIKGTSVLASTLDIVDGIPIDYMYMHAVLEGVTPCLVWFKSKTTEKPFI